MPNYASLPDYISYLETVSKRSNKFLIGNFYSYEYAFDRTEKDFEITRFYDRQPLVYVIAQGPTENTVVGFNFHQLPVRSRLLWLTRFDKFTGIKEDDSRNIFYYEFVREMFKKAIYGIRLYRKERIKKLRQIDSTKMYDLVRYYSNTYYGASIDAIEVRYASFNVYK